MVSDWKLNLSKFSAGSVLNCKSFHHYNHPVVKKITFDFSALCRFYCSSSAVRFTSGVCRWWWCGGGVIQGKNHDCIFNAFLCVLPFLYLQCNLQLELSERKKSSFEFLKMIMHNLSIYYNYLCDSMQFSNAFEVEICELCFEAQNGNAQKKNWCECVCFFYNSIKMCCAKMWTRPIIL